MCVSACFHVTVPESLVRRHVVFTATEEELISFIYNVIFPSALIRLANANTTSSTVRPTGPDTISWCFSSGVTAATVYGCQHTPKSYLCCHGQWGAEQKMLCWQQAIMCKDQSRRFQSRSDESHYRVRYGRGRGAYGLEIRWVIMMEVGKPYRLESADGIVWSCRFSVI